MTSTPAPIRNSSPLQNGAIAAVVAGVIITLSILWLASETHYRGCIEKANAKFPAIPVSAYVVRDKSSVGPLKVSFVDQRTRAVDDCHRFF